jgi:hypothetical protein
MLPILCRSADRPGLHREKRCKRVDTCFPSAEASGLSQFGSVTKAKEFTESSPVRGETTQSQARKCRETKPKNLESPSGDGTNLRLCLFGDRREPFRGQTWYPQNQLRWLLSCPRFPQSTDRSPDLRLGTRIPLRIQEMCMIRVHLFYVVT